MYTLKVNEIMEHFVKQNKNLRVNWTQCLPKAVLFPLVTSFVLGQPKQLWSPNTFVHSQVGP